MTDGDDNGARSKNSARECLDEMARNVATLLVRYDALEKTLERLHDEFATETRACRQELSNIHERISNVRSDLTQVHIDLASAISYSKGSKAAHKSFLTPVVAVIGTVVSGLLVWIGTRMVMGGGN